jgi:hypothetical protein
MATADVLRKEDAPEGEDAACAAVKALKGLQRQVAGVEDVGKDKAARPG